MTAEPGRRRRRPRSPNRQTPSKRTGALSAWPRAGRPALLGRRRRGRGGGAVDTPVWSTARDRASDVVVTAVRGCRRPPMYAVPRLDRRLVGALATRGIRDHTTRRDDGPRCARRSSSRRPRQADALLQRAGAEHHPPRPVGAGAVSLSDQGAGAGPAGRAARAVEPAVPARRAGAWRLHLRRRYAAGRAPRHPRPRARGAQQSRHGPLGHPAAPSALGEAVREPALRRDRRTACVSRRIWQPSHQRAAAAAAPVPALRLVAGLRLHVGDHRQSVALASASPRRRWRWSIAAARRDEVLHFVNPPVINSQLGIRRSCWPRPPGDAPVLAATAGDRLRAEPPRHRIWPPTSRTARAPRARRWCAAIAASCCAARIERGLRENGVRAVVSTSASARHRHRALDASIMAGYRASATWQRAGRAGSISSWSAPRLLLRRSRALSADNRRSCSNIKCAAFELPFG